ncbi:MAG: hypothetical protein WA842_01690 [Croceibacterium sp.]
MATAKKRVSGSPARTGARWGWRSLAVIAAMVVIVAGWYWRVPIFGYANTGAAVGAHSACSCRYIAGRSLGDCKKDFEPGMELVFLSDDEDERAVTARVPLLASETARYSPGRGCVLDPWKE